MHDVVWCMLNCLTDTAAVQVLQFLCVLKVKLLRDDTYELLMAKNMLFLIFYLIFSYCHFPEQDGTLQQCEVTNTSSVFFPNFTSQLSQKSQSSGEGSERFSCSLLCSLEGYFISQSSELES